MHIATHLIIKVELEMIRVGLVKEKMQNNNYGSYLTQNFYLQNCGMKKPIEFATSQPSVFFKGTHLGMGGCNVDSDSNLKMGTIQTNPKCKN